MSIRSPEDCWSELEAIDAAQIANEAQRDAFVALGHTALFAASIAFIGDVRPAGEAETLWSLYIAWASSIVGLIALMFSFDVARRAANSRRRSIYYQIVDDSAALVNLCNAVARWTFPISLIFLAAFAAINVR